MSRLKLCDCLSCAMCCVTTRMYLNRSALHQFHINYADMACLVCALTNIAAAGLGVSGAGAFPARQVTGVR